MLLADRVDSRCVSDSGVLPPSPVVAGLRWAPPESVVRLAAGSDNWPLAWADDDRMYTAYGDGWGFVPKVPEKLSLGFACIEGGPDSPAGTNIRSQTGEQHGDGRKGGKASGILCLDGSLYLWVRNTGNSRNGHLQPIPPTPPALPDTNIVTFNADNGVARFWDGRD